MTVKELISWLTDCPPDAEVLVWDMGQGGQVGIAPVFNPTEEDAEPTVVIGPVDEREIAE